MCIESFCDPSLDHGLTIYSKPHGLRIKPGDHPLRKIDVDALYLSIRIHWIIEVEELFHVFTGIECRFQFICLFYPAHKISPLLQSPCVLK